MKKEAVKDMFSARLFTLIKKSGKSRAQIAEEIGAKPQLVYAWILGYSLPQVYHLQSLKKP